MTAWNDTATYTLLIGAITAAITAGLAYASNRFASRRSSVADTLVVALRDAQRSRFLLDLTNSDHARLLSEPVAAWVAAVSNIGRAAPSTEDILKKCDEVLSWRVEEREARIRFAIIARAHDVHRFAGYHRALYGEAIATGRKTVKDPDSAYKHTVDELIDTVVSARVPSILRPVNYCARKTPGVRDLLVEEDDVRMLVADYTDHPVHYGAR
jgi:hypothetical protein